MTSNTTDRRHFLGGLAALAAGVSLVVISGCGTQEPKKVPYDPEKKTLSPAKKPK
jgi:hypothetical protein